MWKNKCGVGVEIVYFDFVSFRESYGGGRLFRSLRCGKTSAFLTVKIIKSRTLVGETEHTIENS